MLRMTQKPRAATGVILSEGCRSEESRRALLRPALTKLGLLDKETKATR